MLQLTTLLPTPHGARVLGEEQLWERVVLPFLGTLGYTEQHVQQTLDAQSGRQGWLLSSQPRHALPLADGQPDMLLALEAGRTTPGELLERAVTQAERLVHMPPLLALVYPQRSGFVLAVFNVHTRMSIGASFPSPDELHSMAFGLRLQHQPPVQVQSPLTWVQRLEEAQQKGDSALELHALQGLVETLLLQGLYQEALEPLARLADLPQILQEPAALARVLRDIGLCAISLERWTLAEQNLLKALDLYRELQMLPAFGATLLDLAAVQVGVGNPEGAELMLKEALALAREKKDVALEGTALNNLGQVYLAQSRLTEAAAALERALELTQAQGQPREEVLTRFNLAVIYQQQGRDDVALRLIKEVKRLSEAVR